MADYSSLKATINANIKANANQEITGPILNAVLTDMVDALAAGYTFAGVATTATSPGTPDEDVFYVAVEQGTYTNFDSLTVGAGEIALLTYNGSWTKHTVELEMALEDNDDADLDIADESDNVLARFSDGHLRTANFNSRDIIPAAAPVDFAVSDPNGYTCFAVHDGHVITKNFNSSEVLDSLAFGTNRPSYASIADVTFNDSMTTAQQALFDGLDDGTLDSTGLTLTAGIYPVAFQKCIAFDDEKFQLRVTATATDKILFYATYTATGALNAAENCSYVLFDFVNGRISIYTAASIDTSTGAGTELTGVDFTVSGTDYILEIGRKNREVYASLYNVTDAESVTVTATERNFPNVNVGLRPAGWMYYYPSFLTLAGTPVYHKFSAGTRSDLYMLFQGDSFTQGYNVFYDESWTYMAAKHFGNSMGAAISGSRLARTIQQYEDSIKGIVNVKYMVLSVGINDILNGVDTAAEVATWAATYKDYLDELVADGITPIVNRIWPEGSSNSTYASAGQMMNDYIRGWGFDGADFGNVTGYNTNTTYYSNTHLNPAGNLATYQRFANELSKYKVI